ncbi:MAG TPA: cupredoxin domain-containing protein [Solirubrobacterales bacterium]|nr:cupredoxin domain-containing protein [Solirubrobacterales bacterium]
MKKAAFGIALILAAIALIACGSDDDDSDTTGGATTTTESGSEAGGGGGGEAEGGSAGSATTLDFEADPNGGLAYTAKDATSEAGEVTVNFTNPQPLSHDVAIEDAGGKEVGATEVIGEGSDSTVVDLKPGEYTFFCSVPGHREAGMEGKLTVK